MAIQKQKEWTIETETEVFDYLCSQFPDLSKKKIKSYFLHDQILVDGKTIRNYHEQLKPGQRLILGLEKIHGQKYYPDIPILYEDDDLIVIDKPASLLSISTGKETEMTAFHFVSDYIKRKKKYAKIFVVHRLDRETSGILMFAKHEKVKHMLQNNWNQLVKKRGYIAIVEGNFSKKAGTIQSYLLENKNGIVYSTKREKEGKFAITHYTVEKEMNSYSLVALSLETGRKNQIRVHMKDSGHPIIGDKKYGSSKDPIKRLGLHANQFSFIHPITKKLLYIESPYPLEFISFLKNRK